MAERPILYFVRHGETDWNAEARLQGTRDVPLNATGREQAKWAANHISAMRPDYASLDYICSPLIRTRETMALLRETLNLPQEGVLFDDRLREIAFGIWEGMSWPEIHERDADLARKREADRWNFRPPDGESYAEASLRVQALLNTIERDTVIVAHGGIARVMLALIDSLPGQDVAQMHIWQGKVLMLNAGSHRWVPT